nr:hypothetical protein [Tanacetum cinerariifolium]
MKGFATNDQANYYLGITSITVNGNNAYELKGKFLDDLHNNAFSDTNEEDAVERALWDDWKLERDEVEPQNEKLSILKKLIRMMNKKSIYEWNKTCHGYTKNHGLTLDWREDRYCNGGNLPGAYIAGNTLHYKDLEWYDALKDSELKEEALRNKAIMEGLINEDVESNDEGWRSWDDFENTNDDRNE